MQAQSPAPSIPSDEIQFLKKAFKQFEENSHRLEQAYSKMQADFRKLNLELDSKNEELKRTLDETRTTRERLNSILQSLKNGVIVVDVDGRITHFNRAAEMRGIRAEKAVGRPYSDVIPGNGEARGLLDTLRTGEEIRNEEREIETGSGGVIPISYSASLVEDGKGNTLGAVEVMQDITQVKDMEREVQQARTLAALGEMSATVAHEIRNPLGGIGSYAALLERDLDRDDPRRKLVKKVLEGIATLNKIVTNLLVYTRPMVGGTQRVDLNAFVKEIADFAFLEIQDRDRTSIQLVCNFPKRPLFSRIAPEKMQQLLLNLFFNAAQAMRTGGEIRVGLKQTRKSPQGEKKPAMQTWNCIRIEDTGAGIPAEHMEKIFNPFFTTKENGTGLGLAIVRKIAEFHKGAIVAKSAVGKGTAFELYLPAVEIWRKK